jgi:hypothetical protein
VGDVKDILPPEVPEKEIDIIRIFFSKLALQLPGNYIDTMGGFFYAHLHLEVGKSGYQLKPVV